MDVDQIDLEIDRERLDEEWLLQPLYAEVAAHELSDAKMLLDEARSQLDVVRAELDSKIRNDPESFGLQKVTEKAVENAIVLCEDYQQARERVSKASHQVGVLSALVTAVEHRKKALESLVSLFGMSYFGKPQANTEEAKEVEKRTARRRLRKKAKKQ